MKINKTKIIATLGPASSSKTMMSKLISSGVDVFRVNFSHANHDNVERIVNDIKSLRVKHNKHVSILGDLQGPKIRLGNVLPDTVLKKGDQIVFSTTKIKNGDLKKITINYISFPKDVKKGETVLVDDGKIILEFDDADFAIVKFKKDNQIIFQEKIYWNEYIKTEEGENEETKRLAQSIKTLAERIIIS